MLARSASLIPVTIPKPLESSLPRKSRAKAKAIAIVMPATTVAITSSSANSHSHSAVSAYVRITAIEKATPGIAPIVAATGNAQTRANHFASHAG